jgi:NAD(P)-dependent dehydrogenase (short-subunit alcohol dehydrogenase family)
VSATVPSADRMSPYLRPLEDQWAVVTGASKGIGFGIAAELVAAGANVVLVARGREALDGAVAALGGRVSAGQAVIALAADTGDPGSIDALFAQVRAEVPALNILVANAGSGFLKPFLDLTPADWDQVMALNLTGTFRCCQEAARMMVGAPAGSNRSIVVVSSIRGLGVRPGLVPYAVSKAGVNQLVRSVAYELAAEGIRVNAVSPGITVTPMSSEDNPELLAERTRSVPMGRAGTPADMAAAVTYLCHPASAFVTGTNLVVDGGESLW